MIARCSPAPIIVGKASVDITVPAARTVEDENSAYTYRAVTASPELTSGGKCICGTLIMLLQCFRSQLLYHAIGHVFAP